MPIYEYECTSCTEIIEAWQSLSDKPMVSCPSCSGTLKKLISQSSFRLKGGGWYADGYSSKPADNKDNKDNKECSKKCPAPSKSKPCAKAEKTSCANA
jgi:putative FmdB family regulatory protein